MAQNTETIRRRQLTSAATNEISEGIAEQRRLRSSLRAIGIEVDDLLDPAPRRKPAKPKAKGRQRRRRALDPNAHIKLVVAVPVARLALFAARHRQWVELQIECGKRITSDRRDHLLELDRNIFTGMVTPLMDKYPALHDAPRYIGEHVALWMREEFARAGDAINADDCPQRYFFRFIKPVEPESDGYGGVEGTNIDPRKIVAFRLPRVRHPYSHRLIDMGTVTCESPADDLTIGIYNGQYRLRSGTIIVNDDGTLAFEISFERLKQPPKAKPVHAGRQYDTEKVRGLVGDLFRKSGVERMSSTRILPALKRHQMPMNNQDLSWHLGVSTKREQINGKRARYYYANQVHEAEEAGE